STKLVTSSLAKYKDIESPSLSIRSKLDISSLTLEVDREVIPADSYTKASARVLDQANDDVTNFVEMTLNGEVISSTDFTSGTTGVYQLKATYEGVESNVVSVQVDPFTVRKVLIEEFTGEWCGWCPEAAHNLETLVEEHPYVLTVGIHNGDGLVFDNEDIIRDAFGINGFPGGLVGRVNLVNVGYNSNPIDPAIANEYNRQIYNETVMAGVGISSKYVGSDLEVDVSINFYENIQEEVRVTIYIIENEVMGGTQQNYFSNNAGFENYYYYPKPAQLSNFVHQFVLRKAATDILGDVIPAESVVKGSTFNLETKTVDMSNYRSENSYVIAFIHYPMSGSKKILNAQQVKAGQSIGIDK
ncbi:MAG: Omp28-related outer membrane protein, partial [Bacteroidota bacterium]